MALRIRVDAAQFEHILVLSQRGVLHAQRFRLRLRHCETGVCLAIRLGAQCGSFSFGDLDLLLLLRALPIPAITRAQAA